MKRILKNNGYLLIVFIIFFIFLYFINFQNNFKDSLINYAFAKAIVEGEIPYLDFNLISTPLFTFVTSIGLFICNNYLTFLIEQTLLLTICYYLLHRLFGRKSILFLLIAPLTYCANIMPTYNFMCFFMIIVIIYMENNHSDKDYLIGILIALALFSKQTVGFFTIFPSIIFYHNNLDKLKKRFVGFLIPCIIFLLYLILNKALYEFFDLCLFGMVDFLNYNGFKRGLIKEYIELRCLILFCVCTFIMLYLLKKNKRDINLLYLLNGVLFLFPLFDLNHLAYFLNCFVVAILPYIFCLILN